MYFKILKEDLTHYGFTYKKGLNIDVNPFDPTPKCGDGLFFTDEKYILGFCDYGTKIAEVRLPEGEMIVQVEEKYKAHSIILGKIYDLWMVETFEWLLKCGVNLHVSDDFVLKHASDNGHLDVVKYLVEHNADINAGDVTALCYAAYNGHLEIVKFLVEHKADIHVNDDLALSYAARKGHLEVVQYLVNQGADIHAKNEWALKWAVESDHVEVVKFLIDQGADLYNQDINSLFIEKMRKHLSEYKETLEWMNRIYNV
jgi:hypothetical protein